MAPTGPPYPGGTSGTPETRPSWELSSGDIARVLKEREEPHKRPAREPDTKTSLPNRLPSGGGLPAPKGSTPGSAARTESRARQQPLHPGPTLQNALRLGTELPRDRRVWHPEPPDLPGGRGGGPAAAPRGPAQQPRHQSQGATGDRCAWPAAPCTRSPSVLEVTSPAGGSYPLAPGTPLGRGSGESGRNRQIAAAAAGVPQRFLSLPRGRAARPGA